MNLQTPLLSQLDNPALTRAERARLRCEAAKELEEAGNYEAARAAMGELWQRIGERPQLKGLNPQTSACVLLRAGVLTGWIGSSQQIEGAQETAKNLIGESLSIFEAEEERESVAEALTELSVCYWREGAYDEARLTLQEALSRLGDSDGKQKAVTLLKSALVELSATRYRDALRVLSDAAPLFLASSSHALEGKYHGTIGLILDNLSEGEDREGLSDRALIEYTAASFHFEQAGHTYFQARTENDLGFLLFRNGRLSEADEHLNRARRLFQSIKDNSGVAQVDDTRARTLLAQGRNAEAEALARSAVRTLEKGDERSVLAAALMTKGTILARQGRYDESRLTFQYAMEVAHRAGAPDDAGLAALFMIEELGESLTASDMRQLYERADRLLANSQHPGTLLRLRKAVRRILAAERASHRDQNAKGFSATLNFVYKSAQMGELLRAAHRVAGTNGPALITGEVGTGKRMLARMMHDWSERHGQFVAINCAALDPVVAESQLFGELKDNGAGAVKEHAGAARHAAGGTLFLDEVSQLSMSNQGKLLRLIEYGKVYVVGSPQAERVDVRIIAASNHPLKEAVEQGRFREDLFYRLQTFHLKIPPLRERTEDIPLMAERFIRELLEQNGPRVTFRPDAIEAMRLLPLRGNARELRSLIESTVMMAPLGSEITREDVETLALRSMGQASLADAWKGCSLEQEVAGYEASLIRRALEEAKGSVTRAARLLGITHQGLAFIIQGRHKDLLSARTPIRERRKRSSSSKSLSGKSKRKRR
ncbi:MAG: sigma 54-interacting transcriptional regulator [Pyrinomonadaceae bacterium]